MKILIFSLVFQSIYSLHPVSAIRPVKIRYSAASKKAEAIISFLYLLMWIERTKWLNTSYRSVTNLGMVILST